MCCFSVACEWVVTAVLIDLDLSLCSKPDNTQCHSLVGNDALLFNPCKRLNTAYTNFLVVKRCRSILKHFKIIFMIFHSHVYSLSILSDEMY